MLTKAFKAGEGKEIIDNKSIQQLIYLIKKANQKTVDKPKEITRKEVEIIYLCSFLLPHLKEELKPNK